jgi:hypothetical protein
MRARQQQARNLELERKSTVRGLTSKPLLPNGQLAAALVVDAEEGSHWHAPVFAEVRPQRMLAARKGKACLEGPAQLTASQNGRDHARTHADKSEAPHLSR